MYIELLVITNSSDNLDLIFVLIWLKIGFLQNNLMLNMNKTQLLNISKTSSVFPSVIIESITINKPNLGFIFDDNLHFPIR